MLGPILAKKINGLVKPLERFRVPMVGKGRGVEELKYPKAGILNRRSLRYHDASRHESGQMKRKWLVLILVSGLSLAGGFLWGGEIEERKSVSHGADPGSVLKKARPVIVQAHINKKNTFIHEGIVRGGQIYDPIHVNGLRWGKHAGFERLVMDIYKFVGYAEQGPPIVTPHRFEVAYEHYPFRLVFTLFTVQSFSAEKINFSETDLIQNFYPLPYWGDEGVKITIVLNGPIEFEVFELHNPAKIVIDLRPMKPVDWPDVYSLRTAPAEPIELFGNLEEEIFHVTGKEVRVLEAEGGGYLVEEGYYATKKEAEERREILKKKGLSLVIENRGPLDIPANMN